MVMKPVIEVWLEVAGAAGGDALADAAAELVDMHEGGVLRPGVLRRFADALRAEGYPAPPCPLPSRRLRAWRCIGPPCRGKVSLLPLEISQH